MPDWNDVTPRFGVAYDLFGNGKTAVKFNIGRYLEAPNPLTFTRIANPAGGLIQSATRTWSDANGDFVPQASELGALNPPNFGTTVVSTRYADDVLSDPDYNWEIGAQLQHEIARGCRPTSPISAAGTATSSSPTTRDHPADYSPYSVVAPVDSRLARWRRLHRLRACTTPTGWSPEQRHLAGVELRRRDRALQRRGSDGERATAARASSSRAA